MAFLALMLLMFFALNQNQAIVQSQREAAAVELEVLANGVAAETMQYIATKPFDARVADGTVNLQNQDVNALTHPNDFPTGATLDDCENLEDFNHMQPDTVFFQIDTDDAGEPVGFEFAVQAAVDYIDAYGQVSASPTWTKELTLYVEQVVPSGKEAFLLRPIIKKRRFSPEWDT
jgi:hypothetical protein